MSVDRFQRPAAIPQEGRVSLSQIMEVAARTMVKCGLLDIVMQERRYDSLNQEFMNPVRMKKFQLFEMAGQRNINVWMDSEKFRAHATDESVRMLEMGFMALGTCALTVFQIWSAPSMEKKLRRESLSLLFQIQGTVERILESMGIDEDYDQNLAKWWVWGNCESVGLKSLKLKEMEISEGSLERLATKVHYLNGVAGLTTDFESCETDETTNVDSADADA